MADLEGMTFAELSAIDPAELSVDELAVLKRRMKDLAFEKIRAANVVQDAKIADEHLAEATAQLERFAAETGLAPKILVQLSQVWADGRFAASNLDPRGEKTSHVDLSQREHVRIHLAPQTVPERERTCPQCGGALGAFGHVDDWQVEYVPGHFEVRTTEREQLSCRHCRDVVVIAPAPPKGTVLAKTKPTKAPRRSTP